MHKSLRLVILTIGFIGLFLSSLGSADPYEDPRQMLLTRAYGLVRTLLVSEGVYWHTAINTVELFKTQQALEDHGLPPQKIEDYLRNVIDSIKGPRSYLPKNSNLFATSLLKVLVENKQFSLLENHENLSQFIAQCLTLAEKLGSPSLPDYLSAIHIANGLVRSGLKPDDVKVIYYLKASPAIAERLPYQTFAGLSYTSSVVFRVLAQDLLTTQDSILLLKKRPTLLMHQADQLARISGASSSDAVGTSAANIWVALLEKRISPTIMKRKYEQTLKQMSGLMLGNTDNNAISSSQLLRILAHDYDFNLAGLANYIRPPLAVDFSVYLTHSQHAPEPHGLTEIMGSIFDSSAELPPSPLATTCPLLLAR